MRSPTLVKRIFQGYYNTLIRGKDTLRSIELAIDYKCQATCHKCYSANLGTHFPNPNYVDKPMLTVDQIRDIIDQGMKMGLIHVNITGGEPTLRKDLVEIVEACRPKEIMVSLVTNALSLSKEKLRVLSDLGLNLLQISLDSSDPKTHDELRGVPGCYDKVMQTAAWAREFGINLCFVTVMSTESSSNASETRKLLEIAEREKAYLLISDAASVGGWAEQDEKVMTRAERDQTLFELMKHPRVRHHNMFNFRAKKGCPAAHEKIYITSHGDVGPCSLVHDTYGNTKNERLEEITNKLRKDPLWSQTHETCPRYLEEEFATRGGTSMY
jgi:MoaA/NifB/PqqE/SkfB family radical SAM enzyme